MGVVRRLGSGDGVAVPSPAGGSLQFWTVYLFVLGTLLLLIPDVILGLVGVAETEEVWLRGAGMLVVLLEILYASSFVATTERPQASSSPVGVAQGWLG